jgi:glucokinase
MGKVIGIDVGGTKIKGGRFADGYLEKVAKNPTAGDISRESVIAAIRKTIDALWTKDVEKIGIVSAGNIDPVAGVCTLAYNLKGWTGCPIKSIFESFYHVPVYVENDAIGALYGEMSMIKEKKNVTMLTFGTGVGGASIINGVLSRSSDTAWGHVVMIPNGLDCTCGKKGCAEMYLSANALFKVAKEKIPELTSTVDLDRLYGAKDPRAIAIMKDYAAKLNLFLNQIESTVKPSLIILGGGLMGARMMKELIALPKDKYAFAQLGNQAGIVGASLLPY